MTDWAPLIPHLVHDVRALVRRGLSSAQLVERITGTSLEPEAAAVLQSSIAAQKDLNHLMTRIGVLADAARPRDPKDLIELDTAILGAKVHCQVPLEESAARFLAADVPACLVSGSVTAILIELVGNAVRFRHLDRPLQIQIDAVRAGEGVRISVSDNGSGWNPLYQDKLMQPLEKLDSDRGGFGLGLAIALTLSESCGGQLNGQSRPEGSCFLLDVPAVFS